MRQLREGRFAQPPFVPTIDEPEEALEALEKTNARLEAKKLGHLNANQVR